ncbi:DUF6909 family protein [Candidatus Solirubrobacter pratensis]|uniref:DUF6909 family protein n=1 Tax=Candidatus Solirubrobacter pratensis TaxID=1298857 RepID=UPI0012DDFEAD|nr:hypothetical protein [Candidatus Solirubrobacter pratensis]
MAVPRLRVPPTSPDGMRQAVGSEEVELYHRTYTTLLRSSGETRLRVLEPSHAAMSSSLHSLAGSLEEIDLGAFLYALRRLPAMVWRANVIVMGQETEQFSRAGVGRIEDWEAVEAPARRRRWYDSGTGTLAVLLASTSDLDDVIPTLVAYQLEWNKLNALLRGAELPEEPEAADMADRLGGSEADWERVRAAWPDGLAGFVAEVRELRLDLRIRMLGGSQIGYARLTRRWWAPVRATLTDQGLGDRPIYFVSSNPHSLVNLVTTGAGASEGEIVSFVDARGPDYLMDELERFRSSRTVGSWENFLYYGARLFYAAQPEDGPVWELRRRHERELGITHLSSRTGLRVSAQVIQLSKLDPAGLDSRLGPIDGERLARSPAVVVNIEYPLGLAAYNILREIAVAHDTLRGVYVLGKAATLNADVGDVLISGVIHDEHSGSTYWLDNAFSFDDIAPYLVFGSGLDNQRAVTVKSTFLQNRQYLDFYYREAYTVVEMEAGPFCNAVYEIADADRYPQGEAVNFAKLPIDLGIIHYASDTPYTQARTLGARGLSYFGMDSTYASSVAIMRRIFALEGMYS